jgi:hypothetical protein
MPHHRNNLEVIRDLSSCNAQDPIENLKQISALIEAVLSGSVACSYSDATLKEQDAECYKQFAELCADLEIDPDVIRGRRRHAHLVEHRKHIARALYSDDKFSLPQVGRVMNRDHSMIKYYVDERFAQRKNEKAKEYHMTR